MDGGNKETRSEAQSTMTSRAVYSYNKAFRRSPGGRSAGRIIGTLVSNTWFRHVSGITIGDVYHHEVIGIPGNRVQIIPWCHVNGTW